MNRGGSLSGRERHCVFLNMGATSGGAPQFANLNRPGSGLDLPDDGRAIALTDWDGDGDVDLWISNRNAPRLRFMRNDSACRESLPVSLQLPANGTSRTGNRDAIGARVEIVTSDGGRSIRTLRAGEGYLAQSSKEILQVGLGRAEAEIEKLDRALAGPRRERWRNSQGSVGWTSAMRSNWCRGKARPCRQSPPEAGLHSSPRPPDPACACSRDGQDPAGHFSCRSRATVSPVPSGELGSTGSRQAGPPQLVGELV